jgi:ribosomal protein L11
MRLLELFQRKLLKKLLTAKMPDLSAADIEAAKRTIEGSIRSAGLKVGLQNN